MGKRLGKRALLQEIDQRRTELDACLAQVPRQAMSVAGVTPGGWSIKDILGHLIEWQAMNLRWHAEAERGVSPAVPAPGYTWRDLPALNATIYRKHHRRALSAVLTDYDRYHSRMLALVQSVPDPELTRVNAKSWTGPAWTLSDYIRANTAAHYLWATKRIRRWWRQYQPRRVQRLPFGARRGALSN